MAAHLHVAAAPFRTIIYATDLSDSAVAALPLVRGIASRFQSHVIIAHVIDASEYQALPVGLGSPMREQTMSQHDQAVGRLLHSPWLQELDCEPKIAEGDVSEELMRIIREERGDLLIVGTSGRKGLNRMMLGSVAEELFRSVSCPVLTVGPHCLPAREHEVFRHILCPTDFTPSADNGAHHAISLAHQFGSRLTFLHAVHPDVLSPSERYRITREFTERMEEYTTGYSLEAPVDYIVEFDHARQAVLTKARELDCDLIVMGVRDAGPLTRAATHLPGPTAFAIVTEAPCPVLTFRHAAV